MIYFCCCNTLRIDNKINLHILIQHFRCMNSIFNITNAGNGMLDAMVLRHQTGNHVDLIAVRAGNQYVGITNIRVSERRRAAGIAFNRQNVQRVLDNILTLSVQLHNNHIKLILSEQLSNTKAQLACASYNNTHFMIRSFYKLLF